MCFRTTLIRAVRTPFQSNARSVSRNGTRYVLYASVTLANKRLVTSDSPSTSLRVHFSAERLTAAITGKSDIGLISARYRSLIEAARIWHASRNDSSTHGSLTYKQIVDIIYALAVSARPADLALIEQLLSDLPIISGLEYTAEFHTTVIRALLEHARLHTAHRWLTHIKLKPGKLVPTLEQWHMFLECCAEKGEVGWLCSGIEAMRESGCQPTNETFEIRIRSMSDSTPPRMEKVVQLIIDIHMEGLPFSETILRLIYDSFARYAFVDYAAEAQRLYLLPFKKSMDDVAAVKTQCEPWNDVLSEVAQTEGPLAAIRRCKAFQRRGVVPSSRTLSAILKHTIRIADLRHAERELRVSANVFHWTVVINNVLRNGDTPTALVIYQESKNSGIQPDAAMAHPLIISLCRIGFSSRCEEKTDQALEIYKDLVLATSEQQSDSSHRKGSQSRGPDAAVYTTLLRAISSSSNEEKYYPIAMSLLEDMRSRQIPMDNSSTVTSVTLLLMRNSRNYGEAFSVYERLCRNGGRSRLDQRGFEAVLAAFSKLSFGDNRIPPLQYYFDIVRDMRNAGYGTTGRVYTTLLKQLAAMATRNTWDPPLPEEFLHCIASAVRRTHDYLTLDASVSPNAHVWTQLMDAYQRCGYFVDAYRVWDVMYLSGQYDSVSVTVIFDACGFAGALEVALKIWTKLKKDGYSFDQENWKAWLECLCRIGRLDDAMKMLCMEMGKEQHDVSPDEACVRVLLSFARVQNQQGEVRSRIRRYLPELWKVLPEDMRVG